MLGYPQLDFIGQVEHASFRVIKSFPNCSMYVNTVTENKKKGEVKPPRVAKLDSRYIPSHVITKGTTEDVLDEVMKFNSREFDLDRHWPFFESALDEIATCGTTHEDRPHVLSTSEALSLRREDATPGEPYRSKYSTIKELKTDHDLLCAYFDELEFNIIAKDGEPDFEDTFHVHSKKDKYSRAKLISRRFRTIQGASAFVQHLTDKYLGWASKACASHKACMTSFQLGDFAPRLLKRLGASYYAGGDFSGYDRCISGDLLERLMLSVCRRVEGMPEQIARYLSRVIARGCLVLPNGKVIERYGGNPSGHGLTTFINCVFHLGILRSFEHWMESEGRPIDFSEMVCGDDGVYSFHHKEHAQAFVYWFPHFCCEHFGLLVGFDQTLDGESVHTFPEMPTFLGRNIISTSTGTMLPLLVNISRVTASAYNDVGDNEVLHREKLEGVHVALAAWGLLKLQGYTVPLNYQLLVEDLGRSPPESVLFKLASGISRGDEAYYADPDVPTTGTEFSSDVAGDGPRSWPALWSRTVVREDTEDSIAELYCGNTRDSSDDELRCSALSSYYPKNGNAVKFYISVLGLHDYIQEEEVTAWADHTFLRTHVVAGKWDTPVNSYIPEVLIVVYRTLGARKRTVAFLPWFDDCERKYTWDSVKEFDRVLRFISSRPGAFVSRVGEHNELDRIASISAFVRLSNSPRSASAIVDIFGKPEDQFDPDYYLYTEGVTISPYTMEYGFGREPRSGRNYPMPPASQRASVRWITPNPLLHQQQLFGVTIQPRDHSYRARPGPPMCRTWLQWLDAKLVRMTANDELEFQKFDARMKATKPNLYLSTCVICMDEACHRKLARIQPCKHESFCYPCAENVLHSGGTCPLCRGEINCIEKIHLASFRCDSSWVAVL